MSTLAVISLQTDNGYDCISVNNDGGMSGVGQTLRDVFCTTEQVIALVALGNCSRIAGVANLSEVIAYHRDKGQPWDDVEPRQCATVASARWLFSPMYHYVWNGESWSAYRGSDKLAWNK